MPELCREVYALSQDNDCNVYSGFGRCTMVVSDRGVVVARGVLPSPVTHERNGMYKKVKGRGLLDILHSLRRIL